MSKILNGLLSVARKHPEGRVVTVSFRTVEDAMAFEQYAIEPAQQEPVAWRELCRRLYVELFHCDRQMMATLDEDGEPVWTQGKTVRDVLADAKAALETSPPASTQEPDPDELTIAYMSGLHEGKKRKPWVGLTDEERHACTQSPFTADNYLAIEAKLKEKNT